MLHQYFFFLVHNVMLTSRTSSRKRSRPFERSAPLSSESVFGVLCTAVLEWEIGAQVPRVLEHRLNVFVKLRVRQLRELTASCNDVKTSLNTIRWR